MKGGKAMNDKNSPTFLELLLSIVFGFLGCLFKDMTSNRPRGGSKHHLKGR